MGLRMLSCISALLVVLILFDASLRLQIYKGMGFEPIADKDGRLTKMLVRESILN